MIDLEVWLKLLPGIFLIISSFYCFSKKYEKAALYLLIFGAFLLRLAAASFDPFLHDWDERFHALVAKNMIENPFKPMLIIDPVLDYNYRDWCCNHIWLHKQPLFLWQMALSMKVFGVNEFAMRLPSAVMGTISVYFIFSIVKAWTDKYPPAYYAAFLFSIAFYQLELTSGRLPVDHNDVAFVFYVTASIWAFTRYFTKRSLKWALLIGLFAGAAIMNKWLTGLIVFSGWGLMLLFFKNERNNIKSYLHMAAALVVVCIVFLPWQIYISNRFPVESAFEYAYNTKHFFHVVEDHAGSIFYHIAFLPKIYGETLVLFFLIGLYFLWKSPFDKSKLTIALLTMVAVVYLFFSIAVTKLPSYTFPVSAIMYGLIGMGLYYLIKLIKKSYLSNTVKNIVVGLVLLTVSLGSFKPWEMAKSRSDSNDYRNAKIHNTEVIKSLPKLLKDDYVILNFKPFENIDLMFYTDLNGFNWYPDEEAVNYLTRKYNVAAFTHHTNQYLPDYVKKHPDILIIDIVLK